MALTTYFTYADTLLTISITDMGERQFLHLNEIEDLLNDPHFIESIDFQDETTIDIVQLPPDKVDEVSDQEDIDDNILDDTIPHDVPGLIELHCNLLETTDNLSSTSLDTITSDFEPIPSTSKDVHKIAFQTGKTNSPNSKLYKSAKRKLPVSAKRKLPVTYKPVNVTSTPTSKTTVLSTGRTKTKKQKIADKKAQSTWKETDPIFSVTQPPDEIENEKRKIIEDTLRDKNPVEVFEMLFDNIICDYIVRQSVLYAAQNNRHSFTFSAECLKKFIGFLLFTGYHTLPQEQLYWCEDEDILIDCVRQCFSRNRYIEIKRNLHFNDNLELPNEENPKKTYKVQPLFDMFNKNYIKFGVFSKNLSIDEQMVRYYGHHYLKQFIRGKPIRFGFKQWLICCGQTGYCFNADLYEGKKKNTHAIEVSSVGSTVVTQKISVCQTPQNHVFYFDNFFTSFDLMTNLTGRNICATGTVRSNRMNYCPVKTDKDMNKEERAAFDCRFDENNKIFAVVWKDNNIVKVLSNHEALEPQQSVSRWSRERKEKVKVCQPKCIASYNKWMGGVDRMDWSINKYRVKIRGKKWYFPIFTNLIDMTLINAHILYTLAGNKIPLLDFRRIITRTYLSISSVSNPRNAGRPSLTKPNFKRVLETVRFDPVGHFIQRTIDGKQRKCGICKSNARKQCSKCNVGLHVECFEIWHTRK